MTERAISLTARADSEILLFDLADATCTAHDLLARRS